MSASCNLSSYQNKSVCCFSHPRFSWATHNCTSRGKMRVKCPRLMFSSWVSKIKRHSASPNFGRIIAEKGPLWTTTQSLHRDYTSPKLLNEADLMVETSESPMCRATIKSVGCWIQWWGRTYPKRLEMSKTDCLKLQQGNLFILACWSSQKLCPRLNPRNSRESSEIHHQYTTIHHRLAVESGAVCDRPMTRLLAEPARGRSLLVICVVSTSGRPKSSKISLQNRRFERELKPTWPGGNLTASARFATPTSSSWNLSLSNMCTNRSFVK